MPGSCRLSASLSRGSIGDSDGRDGSGDLFPSRMDPVVSLPPSRANPPSATTGGANLVTTSPPARIPSSLRPPLVLIHGRRRREGRTRQPPHCRQSRCLSAPLFRRSVGSGGGGPQGFRRLSAPRSHRFAASDDERANLAASPLLSVPATAAQGISCCSLTARDLPSSQTISAKIELKGEVLDQP